MRRRKDWVQRLDVVLQAASKRAFHWRDFNCGIFMGQAVEAVTTEAVLHHFTIKGETKRQAYAALKKFSKGGVAATMEKFATMYGKKEITWEQAKRGDPVIVDSPEGDAFGIVDLTGRYVAVVGPKGLNLLPTSDIKRAWSVD